MAIVKSYTKIKGTRLTSNEASVAASLLNLGKDGWLGAEFQNWSYSNTSNEIVAELQSDGPGLIVEENKDFYPYITYKSPITPYHINLDEFAGWEESTWITDNGNNLRIIRNSEPAQDFSEATNGSQFASGEIYKLFPPISQTKIPNTSKFILQILTQYRENDFAITRSGDFGLIDYNDIPEGGYKIYKSVERDGDNVPKYVKIIRTTKISPAQIYPTLMFVFYDYNSDIITNDVDAIVLTIGGTA